MLEYWGDQLFYGIEMGFANLEAKLLRDYPNSETLKAFVDIKRKELETFKKVTKRFSTLGTETETVRRYLIKIKTNRLSPYYEDATFLSILWQGSLYFEIPASMLEIIKKENTNTDNIEYIQLSFDDIFPKEDSSNDAKDPH